MAERAVLQRVFGPDAAPGEPGEERSDYRETVLEGRTRDAIVRLNPGLPMDAVEETVRTVPPGLPAGPLMRMFGA